jgi:adenine-specific DNA-methyltransferase
MRLALPPTSCKVATPTDLAEGIVKALGDESHLRWLEPSHGTGVFVEAISRLGVRKERLVAVDLNPVPSPADNLATTFRRVDFLKWAQQTDLRFDRIVGNPPFVSIKRLPTSLQKTAASVLDINGQPIGLGANVWYAFVLASLQLLKKGGCLAFVLPSAAEFTNYSAAIRASVRETFGSLVLYRCTRPLFEGVQEGTLVAVARGYGEQPCMVRRRRFQSRDGLIRGLATSGQAAGRQCRAKDAKPSASMVALKSVAKIRLGGVTGDASYFLMGEEKRKFHELPITAVTPVVSKARHLRFAPLERRDWTELKTSGERVWLFNPTASLIRLDPRVKRYVYLDPVKGGCNRDAYKVSLRTPWYRTPLLTRADAFMSGMSQYGPWLCINEMQGLRASNTLYVVTFRSRQREAWYKWALALLTSIAQRQIRGIGRHYADGLVKYEPGPLGEVELPRLKSDADHRSLYQRAVRALLASDTATAKDIADSVRL